jgi:2-dehydropantoate 2-reductase
MLARAGHRVTLIGRRRHIEAIKRNGLAFESGRHVQRIAVEATEEIAEARDANYVLVCVKSFDTDDTARRLAPHLTPNAVVLSLQNGVDNAERIRRHVKNAIMPVLVYAAAQMVAAGHVQHTGGGNLVISRGERAADVAALFRGAGVPLNISENIETELWTKLALNCAYNALSAVGPTPYGQMVIMPEVHAVMTEALQEVARLAEAKGVRLPDNLLETAFKLADVMPVTVSSTAQDIRAGRRTEIDHLNGYVAREGNAVGIATPVNHTLHALVQLLERGVEAAP